MEHQDLTEQDQAFYNDGFRLGNMVASKSDEPILFKSIRIMFKGIDDLINSLLQLAQQQGVSIDCKKGCSWCCHQAIFANSYEIHYLGNYIKKNFSESEKYQLIERVKQKNDKTKVLNEQEVLNFKSPCPLLKNGACMAYEARPMACRIYLSQNVSTCLEFYKSPTNEDNYPALLEFPLNAGKMMNEGFTDALKGKEIHTSEFRLEDGLRIFLSQ